MAGLQCRRTLPERAGAASLIPCMQRFCFLAATRTTAGRPSLICFANGRCLLLAKEKATLFGVLFRPQATDVAWVSRSQVRDTVSRGTSLFGIPQPVIPRDRAVVYVAVCCDCIHPAFAVPIASVECHDLGLLPVPFLWGPRLRAAAAS